MKKNEPIVVDGITEITANINLKDNDSNQLIYASQLYGTFFAVSAKLNVVGEVLCSMDLTLINYKGLYNIGLLDLTKNTWESNGSGEVILVLHLVACGGIHGNGKFLKIDCKDTLISKLTNLIVTRKLHPFGNRTDMSTHLFDDYFDNEFYDRDGGVLRRIDRMDDLKAKSNYSDVNISDKVSIEGRCRDTKSIFLK